MKTVKGGPADLRRAWHKYATGGCLVGHRSHSPRVLLPPQCPEDIGGPAQPVRTATRHPSDLQPLVHACKVGANRLQGHCSGGGSGAPARQPLRGEHAQKLRIGVAVRERAVGHMCDETTGCRGEQRETSQSATGATTNTLEQEMCGWARVGRGH